MTERVSVIVAVRDRADVIGRAIDSVLAQEYPDVELIVVDGASTDGTSDILQARSGDIDRLIIEPDTGIYDAWNKGLGLASGDWIMFLGSDDVYPRPDSISDLITAHSGRDDLNLLTARAALVDRRGVVGATIGTKWGVRRTELCMTIAHPACATRRELLQQFGGFSTTAGIAADYDFYLRARHSIRAADYPEVVVHFSTAGVTGTNRLPLLRSTRDAQARDPQIGRVRAGMQYAGFFLALPLRQSLRTIRSALTQKRRVT
jgi:glycosyltransferase involved in cell wall biosynthesis